MKYLMSNKKQQFIKLLLIGIIIVFGVNGITVTNANEQEQIEKNISFEMSKKLYDGRCAVCHGNEGKGRKEISPKVPDFTNASWQFSKTDQVLFSSIENGKGNGKGAMPKWEGLLTITEIKALVSYIRAFPGKANQLESVDGLYLNYCSSCHAKSGRGKKRLHPIPNFKSFSWQNSKSDEQLYSSICNGFDNKPNLEHSWKSILNDNQINNLVNYIRDFPSK